MKKEMIWKLTGLFFAAMVLFTVLSRAAYQHGTAVVSTEAPKGGTIAHTVQLTGKTVQNQEQAVTTLGGLRVSGVLVNEGARVAQGDVLFTLDLDYLQETILHQKQEMEKQRLSVQDAASQNAASQKRRANEKARAEESYHSAVSRAETALERATRDLERAEAALDDFYNGLSAGQALEEELALACQGAEDSYYEAAADLDRLEREMDAALLQAPEDPEAVRADYAQPIQEARNALARAEQAWNQAKSDLEAQRQQSLSARSEQELLDALERAQEAYEDALTNLDDAYTTQSRSVATANLPEGSNSSARIGQITYEQMELELNKLEALLEGEGKILSPVDGIVTRCAVQTGEKTTDSTAMLLADLSQGCKFSGLLTEDQSKYIGVGDKVTLRAESSGKRYEDLTVTTISPAEEEGLYHLTVQLPANTLPQGATAELRFTKKSQAYPTCVPLSALHLDERNQPYVLVVEQAASVLGEQLQARKVSVTVLDQNETMAALEGGTVHSEQQIIVSSDRPVDSGSRVRVE